MSEYIGVGSGPITPEQRQELKQIAAEGGYEMLDMVNGGESALDLLPECVALMGAFSRDQIMSAAKLKWLQIPWAGVESVIAGELYQNEDAILTNGSGAFGIAISEYMICGLMMIQRRMLMYMDNKQRREWKQYPGITTVYGSNVAVIGVGDLGGNFASRMTALGAHVTGVRRTRTAELPDGFERMCYDIDEAIADADIVALCLPATESTKHIIDRARLSMMKRSAILINVGRGSAIDQDALIDALKAGAIQGAVLDVFTPEPLPEDSELWALPNVVLTPHVSGIDRDQLAAGLVYGIFKENLQRFIAGKPLKNVVDRKIGY